MDKKNTLFIDTKGRMNRPIQFIGDKPYFATNVSIKRPNGEIARTWIVASADFKERYSEVELNGHESFEDAPFHIDLAGAPKPDSTLSVDAYQKHVLDGEPVPDPERVFEQVSQAIDSFVAFDGSFASQKDMSDLLACWVLSTYATGAFDTVGYIWPNGERGSGKTQCLKTVTALAFMGQTITSGSTFASVRDEAMLGATIGFDDCENIRKMEPEKRELLLAGNTKGAGFMLKEPGKREGTWNTRYFDCFAPRCFTSIALPDEVLASRTILIPLTRTGDAKKTRRKPSSLKDWAIEPKHLRDAIWLNIAANLADIERQKSKVNENSDLSGRDFDIFQAVLCIAHWLEFCRGVQGLYARMHAVMEAYHAAKQRTMLPSFENLLLQALLELLDSKSATSHAFSTREIAARIANVCNRMDITDEELTSNDVQKVGMMLGRLRFQKKGAHGQERSWLVNRQRIFEIARTGGIVLEVQPVPERVPTANMPW